MNSDQGPWQSDSAVRSEGLDDHRIGLPGVPLSTKHLEDAFFCYDEGVAKGNVVGLWFHYQPPFPSVECCVTVGKK